MDEVMKQHKKWLIYFTIAVITIFVLLEFLSYGAKDRFRHMVDYKVHLTQTPTKEYKDTLFLSDSVTYEAMGKYKLNDNIMDLTSNQAISLAGNYFMLERYLETHKAPKKVYLFFIYDLFFNQLNSPYLYLYFTTVFTKNQEKDELKYVQKNNVYDKLNYFNLNKIHLKKYLKYYIPGKKAIYDKQYTLKRSKNNYIKKNYTKRLKVYTHAKIIPFSRYFLNKIINLCKEKDIELNLVIEPIHKVQYQTFSKSNLLKYLKEKTYNGNFNLIDTNQYYSFDIDCFREDTIHLTKNFQKKYLDLIDQNIVKLFTYHTKQRKADLAQIHIALESYHMDHGKYPKSQGFDGLYTTWGKASTKWIRGLIPQYINILPRDPRLTNIPKEQYLYRSNGKDFKLISHAAEDCKIVKVEYPELIDPKRDCWAYGYWTEGAKDW